MTKKQAEQGQVNWNDYYTPDEAIEVLRRNSNKPNLSKDYLRTLARPNYGILHPRKLANVNMYPKHEVDAYMVEERGVKLERRRVARTRKTGKSAA